MFDDLWPVWRAFIDLHQSRGTSGFGPLPVQARDVEAWLDLHGITHIGTRVDMYDLIKVLDSEWLKLVDGDAKANQPRMGKK